MRITISFSTQCLLFRQIGNISRVLEYHRLKRDFKESALGQNFFKVHNTYYFADENNIFQVFQERDKIFTRTTDTPFSLQNCDHAGIWHRSYENSLEGMVPHMVHYTNNTRGGSLLLDGQDHLGFPLAGRCHLTFSQIAIPNDSLEVTLPGTKKKPNDYSSQKFYDSRYLYFYGLEKVAPKHRTLSQQDANGCLYLLVLSNFICL